MKINRRMVYDKYKGHCAYCGKEIEFKDMQVDHLYPKRLNSPDCSEEYLKQQLQDINSFDNLMPSCRRCNHYKRAYTLESFRRLMNTLHERITDSYIVKVGIDYGIVKITPFDGKFYFEKE